MKATASGSWVRIETGITPSQVAALFRDWQDAADAAEESQGTKVGGYWSNEAARLAAALHEALNPRLTVGQARAFGWETVNAATTAAREAMNEEGVAG